MIRSLLAALLLCLGGLGSPAYAAQGSLPDLPPLTNPATGDKLPGKFIWADFFTSDIDAALAFYGPLFDWEWRWLVNEPGSRYGLFYQDGEAVAGVAERPAAGVERAYGRWIYYVSVTDVGATLSSLRASGGSTLMDRRDFPDRGSFAVVADAEGVLFGVMDSSSGDPADFRAEEGEWIWFNLYTRQVTQSADFYATLFDYETYAPEAGEDEGKVLDIFLARQGYSRAGVRQLGAGSESQPTWLGYVRVADVGAKVARAKQLGGDVIYSPDDSMDSGELAIVSDPVGAPVGLLRWVFDDEEGGAE